MPLGGVPAARGADGPCGPWFEVVGRLGRAQQVSDRAALPLCGSSTKCRDRKAAELMSVRSGLDSSTASAVGQPQLSTSVRATPRMTTDCALCTAMPMSALLYRLDG